MVDSCRTIDVSFPSSQHDSIQRSSWAGNSRGGTGKYRALFGRSKEEAVNFRLSLSCFLLLIHPTGLAQVAIKNFGPPLTEKLVAQLLERGESGSPRDLFLRGHAFAKGRGCGQQ